MSQHDLFNVEEHGGFDVGDIPLKLLEEARKVGVIACDLETSGLDWKSERIGLVQLFVPGTQPFILKPEKNKVPKRLLELISNQEVVKIFHHAMFDLRFLVYHWKAMPANIACTKISSKILDPHRPSHSLAPLLHAYLSVDLEKSTHQTSDWLSWNLSDAQLLYATRDVLFLPELLQILMGKLTEHGKQDLTLQCFKHLPTRVLLELGGYGDVYAY